MQSNPKKFKNFRKPARQVSEIMEKILEPVLARRTGMSMELLGAWADLVGEQYIYSTRPEKINWPRKTYEDDPFKPGELVVACEPSHALFFQHEVTSLIERVNVFFGFAAISKIRIQQKPVNATIAKPKRKKTKLSDDAKKRMRLVLDKIEDPKLRKSLKKLGKGVYSKRSNG